MPRSSIGIALRRGGGTFFCILLSWNRRLKSNDPRTWSLPRNLPLFRPRLLFGRRLLIFGRSPDLWRRSMHGNLGWRRLRAGVLELLPLRPWVTSRIPSAPLHPPPFFHCLRRHFCKIPGVYNDSPFPHFVSFSLLEVFFRQVLFALFRRIDGDSA